MTNMQTILAFTLIASLAHANTLHGYSNVTINGNDDPKSCKHTLTLTTNPDKVTFTQDTTNPDNICTFHNLQYANTFRGDDVYGNITLAATSGTNKFEGVLTTADLNTFNGRACANMGESSNGKASWMCRFKYGSVFMQIAVFVDKATSTFDASWTDTIFPNFGTTNINKSDGITLLTPNTSFPNIVGMLFDSCNGSTSTVIAAANTSVYITGTDSASNDVDLNTLLGGFVLYDILVRKKNSPQDEYRVFSPKENTIPFDAAGKNGCHDIGLTWGEVLNNDWSYCAGGCEVSFVMSTDRSFILQTSGISTKTTQSTPDTTSTATQSIVAQKLQGFFKGNSKN